MKPSIQKKLDQLGMPIGTAAHQLRKILLFHFVQKAELDFCHQCGAKIESVEELSIEHKTPWLDSEDPVGLFFDLDNIAFSHLDCNCGAARQTKVTQHPSRYSFRKGCRCEGCVQASREAGKLLRQKTGIIA